MKKFWNGFKFYILFGWAMAIIHRKKIAKALDACLEECRCLIEADNKVEAIKYYRNHTGLGLKESKAVIDQLHREVEENTEEREETEEIGFTSEHLDDLDGIIPGESMLDAVDAALDDLGYVEMGFVEVDPSELEGGLTKENVAALVKEQAEEAAAQSTTIGELIGKQKAAASNGSG